MNRQILKEEEEKAKIQKDLSILTDRLSKINESLARKVQARNEYDRTVQETEVSERAVARALTDPPDPLARHKPIRRIQYFVSEILFLFVWSRPRQVLDNRKSHMFRVTSVPQSVCGYFPGKGPQSLPSPADEVLRRSQNAPVFVRRL